jgi:hypothetical protein
MTSRTEKTREKETTLVLGYGSEILAWLSPLEPRIRHQDLRTRRADNVGEWLLQTDEFQRWCNGAQRGIRACDIILLRRSGSRQDLFQVRDNPSEEKLEDGGADEQRY